MSPQANACTKDLTAKLQMGEKILKQAEICRKLETEAEKILPFYAESLQQDELEQITGERMSHAAAPIPQIPFYPHLI